MNRQTRARVVRLERAHAPRRMSTILVASDHEKAERLQAENPEALVIITGVPR